MKKNKFIQNKKLSSLFAVLISYISQIPEMLKKMFTISIWNLPKIEIIKIYYFLKMFRNPNKILSKSSK